MICGFVLVFEPREWSRGNFDELFGNFNSEEEESCNWLTERYGMGTIQIPIRQQAMGEKIEEQSEIVFTRDVSKI